MEINIRTEIKSVISGVFTHHTALIHISERGERIDKLITTTQRDIVTSSSGSLHVLIHPVCIFVTVVSTILILLQQIITIYFFVTSIHSQRFII